MNSRVLFYNVFLFLALLSCSHDGNPEIDETGDATLSLRITIPQIGTRAGDSGIERLYVAIFGTSGENADKLIVSREVTQTNTVEDIDGLTTLDQFLGLTKTIENEDTAPTMSSGVQTYTLKPGKNTIGLQKTGANQISASPVTIYRLIARVYLNQLFLRPLEEYGDEASFKLESVFMANVKNYSRYISTEDWGAVEVSDPSLPDFFLTGANPDIEGIYKEGTSKLSDQLHTAYDYDFRTATDETGLIANCAANAYTVFENMQETTWHTLLILHGTYRYTDKNGTPRNVDTYYPVIVNRQHDQISNVTDHLYVRRNVIYSIDVVIKGPGSDTPYDPSGDATLTSMIEVQAWGEIVENPSID